MKGNQAVKYGIDEDGTIHCSQQDQEEKAETPKVVPSFAEVENPKENSYSAIIYTRSVILPPNKPTMFR